MELLQRAVLNNVVWCSSVCPGDLDPATGIWSTTDLPVTHFPDAITTRPHRASAQVAALTSSRASCFIKDSYADVDLADHGFIEQFTARWIGRDIPRFATPPTDWTLVTTRPHLENWCAAASRAHLLPVGLLSSRHTQVLAKWNNTDVVAGGIATVSNDVVGISNVFNVAHDARMIWDEIVAMVAKLWPSVPMVGYEHGEDLDAAILAGFADLGPVRVWHRPPSPARRPVRVPQ